MLSFSAVCRLLAVALASVVATSAMAWGGHGHRIVATIAASQLTPKARAEVDRMLAVEVGATLATISTWADETRNRTTASWHYVNFPRDSCTYSAQRDCPDGNCVVEAINKQLAILASNEPDDKRLNALKYVVHFVADIHQPLHAGYADDRGGNTYQIQAFGRGTNLHALWDSGLIENAGLDAAAAANWLKARTDQVGQPSAAQMAEESCRIVGMPGFYADRKVGQDYVERFTPVTERQLRVAGARLAWVLNEALR